MSESNSKFIESKYCISELHLDELIDKNSDEFSTLLNQCSSKAELLELNNAISQLSAKISQGLSGTEEIVNDLSSSTLEASEIISESISTSSQLASSVVDKNLSGLAEVVSSIPEGSYPLAFTSGALGALVAAAAAFTLNYFYWKKVNQHNRLSHFASVSIDHLHDFENSSVCYWISNENNSSNEEMIKLEIRIRTQFSILKSSLDELCKKIPESYHEDSLEIKRIIEEMYDDATGGNFESASKVRDRKLALMISRNCLKIKSILIKYSHKIGD
ncbi:hypothetical protein [Vibrio parahaemolyticus]|uniref:hypothetical protein n=1 Tax=Vibrio parahaemolyticus TaxID=670 RepID=UPI00111D7C11|nr:hypothetical protein [Vibrio parahaemolyticus]TOJ30652.1 hypothetical protein CGI43_03160 [Vibrio parahaemolyticus]